MASEKRYNNVLAIIDDRLIPNEEAKKARGEVFTPLPLVREMLFGIRKSAIEAGRTEIWGIDDSGKCIDDDPRNRVGGIPLEVWRDPTTKWLDPANGIGNFPVVAFYMLDFQLGEHGPSEIKGDGNKRKRRKHIVEKMLFMIELNKGNVNTSRKIFEQMVPGASANICCTDSLTMTDTKLMAVFGVNQFNIVMGNPPFNRDGTHQSGTVIWDKFVDKSIDLVHKNGYLLFIIPQGWRTPSYSQTLEKMKTCNILKVVIIGTSQKIFKINFPVDYVILEKHKSKNKTEITNLDIGITDYVDIDKFTIIPNYGWSIFERILQMNIPLLTVKSTSTHNFSTKKEIFSAVKSATFKYPIVKTLNASGITSQFSSQKHIDQDKIKVLVAFGAYLYPTIDDGKFGVSQNVYYILCDSVKEAELLKLYLEHPIIVCLVHALKLASYAVSNKLLSSYIPDPSKFTTTDIASELHLSEKEKNFLERCSIKETGDKSAKVTSRKGKKKTIVEGGARRSKYGRTRKARRFW